MRSLTMMASSKLYPFHGMNATSTLRPRPARRRRSRAVGQHIALLDAVARLHDRALVDARVLVRAEELRERILDAALVLERDERFGAVLVDVVFDDDAVGVHVLDDAVPFGDDRARAHRARSSLRGPCRRSGASGRSSGTAWRCMFEPMRARLASSCSRNGMSAAAALTIWFGATSMYWTSSGFTTGKSPW